MIITKTPLRISILGGGSDLPQFYNYKTGRVLSTTINRYINIAVNDCQPDHVRLSYSKFEQVPNASHISHDRVRHALQHFNFNSNIEIASFSDVPTTGTGLGSSSTFTVGLVKALCTKISQKYGIIYNKTDIAERACYIEMDLCNDPIGKQDQYAAAFGGFNLIEFTKDHVAVQPINVGAVELATLNNNLILISTGIARRAADILSVQSVNLKDPHKNKTFENTAAMVELVELGYKAINKTKFDELGPLLDQAWKLKRSLASGITNSAVDELYERGIKAGATGGKLLGAGGGGYMLFYVPFSNHSQFCIKMIEQAKLPQLPFRFTDSGVQSWVI